MPVYTYECEHCSNRFDAKQSFTDVPLTVCPNCGGSVHRVIQPVGVVFRGSGFYVTDSRGKQNLATTGAKKEDTKSADGSSNGSDSVNGGTAEAAKPAAEGSKTTAGPRDDH